MSLHHFVSNERCLYNECVFDNNAIIHRDEMNDRIYKVISCATHLYSNFRSTRTHS